MTKVNKGVDGRGIYRAVYTSIWDDPEFRSFDSNVKLVFFNLRTSPLSNMPVIYHFYMEAIEKQTGLSHRVIDRALDTLSDTHWIAIQDGIVWIIKGLRFDPNIVLTNKKHRIAIINIILGLPKMQIVKDFIDFYKLEIPYEIGNTIGYGIPYSPENSNGIIQEPEPEPDTEPEPDKDSEKIPYGEFKNVFLSKDEFQKLTIKFGEQLTQYKIESLSSGIESKGYKYKSHYAAILSWDRKNKPLEENKKSW